MVNNKTLHKDFSFISRFSKEANWPNDWIDFTYILYLMILQRPQTTRCHSSYTCRCYDHALQGLYYSFSRFFYQIQRNLTNYACNTFSQNVNVQSAGVRMIPRTLWESVTAQGSWSFVKWRRDWEALFHPLLQTRSARWPLQPLLQQQRLPSLSVRLRLSSVVYPRFLETVERERKSPV